MPFYFRKSVSAGPFRFNFSKSGVGVSVGVRGLRIGTGPRGHYAQVGLGGVYYRTSLQRAGAKQSAAAQVSDAKRSEPQKKHLRSADDVDMVEIDSGNVLAMREETFEELLTELNRTKGKPGWSIILTVLLGVVALFGFAVSMKIGLSLLVVVLAGFLVGKWLDSYKRTSVLFYDLDESVAEIYEQLTGAFDAIVACDQKWHVAAGGDIKTLTSWKRNAGASRLVDKKPTSLGYSLPKVIKSNITPLAAHVGRQVIYFFPDVALIEDGKRFGAVSYSNLSVTWEGSPFIEDGKVPRDSNVIAHTWKHPNKSGGPDRRFRDNYQIPVCMYETMYLRSGSGMNEALQFSKVDVSASFAAGLKSLSNMGKIRTGLEGRSVA